MKVFEGIQGFFESVREYVEGFSNLFLIFLGAFALVSVVVIFITSFAYECKLTKTVDKINKFFERNPRINDDNLVAFNNMMKAHSVPKILRRQWQQFMLYREHSPSYYMSFKHCVENPLRNSTYNQQMTVYKIISYVLVVLSLVTSVFVTGDSTRANTVLKDIVIIPITILVAYWLISMVLNLIHNAISGDLFQNYQYFEINIDKAMLTLPEFVDYEVLFSQDEIRKGIPVLYAYLQKRAIQEQQELEKARLKNVDHEKFDFDDAGLDGSLVLDRAMRETENFTTQRKKYMQETERINNEINVLENNYKEQVKEFQRQVQTSKETVENLKEQLEQASSTIEINYIKKQMRDELSRQQLAEKDFDILTDKHNQSIKALNQEIKHYDDETKKAKEALEVAMLSEFNTYSVKVYDNLEKIVDDKMQDKVDDYKDQIKGLEIELEEKNEELENVYTRYQEVLSQVPVEEEPIIDNYVEEQPTKKHKKKKKGKSEDVPADEGMVQPEAYPEEFENYEQYDEASQQEYANYDQYDNSQEYYDENYTPVDGEYNYDENADGYAQEYYDNAEYGYDDQMQDDANAEYVSLDDGDNQQFVEGESEYIPLGDEQADYGNDSYSGDEQYVPTDDSYEYVPLDNQGFENGVYQPLDSEQNNEQTNENAADKLDDDTNAENFDDSDFNIDFTKSSSDNFDDMKFDFAEEKSKDGPSYIEEDDEDFDLNKVLGLYDNASLSEDKSEEQQSANIEDALDTEDLEEDSLFGDELEAPVVKRKAGRPRKIVDETDEIKPKRSVGRPRKVVDESEITPKRSVGRPKKLVENEDAKPVRKVGRPRKVVEESDMAPKRSVGRPRKNADNDILDKPKRSVGRPRKNKVGRPKKSTALTTTSTGKRGRPRKQETAVAQTKRSVGRPRKSESVKLDNQPKKRGRPRKS